MAWIWASISLIIFLWILHNLFTPDRNKKFPPGPIGLPILGHFHLLGKNPHHDLHRLAQKHGPIMSLRFGLVPVVVLSSPAGAELILKTHDLIFAGRPHFQAAKHMSYGGRNIAFAPYGNYWRNMRKLCTLELLSSSRINKFRPIRTAELGHLIRSLQSAAGRGETVDVSARVSGFIGDVISLMVFGRKFEDDELDERGFKAVIEEALAVAGRPNLGDFFPFKAAMDVQGLERRMKELSKKFDGFLERIIDDHHHHRGKKKKTEEEDFVDTMMGILESGEAEFEFDRRHVKAVLMDMLIAGMDTSTATVEWILSELIRHPKALKKLQQEVEQIVGTNKQLVDESHLDQLEYLNMIIKETYRLHPVAPLLIHESMEDCVVSGFHIRKGSRIIVNVSSIGKDPKIWQDPEKFIPERFDGSHVDLRGHDFELIPFGSGRRSCPGLTLGLIVVKLVVAQLVHCFDWKLPNVAFGSELDMEEHFGLVVGREKPIMAIPTYRLQE